MLKNITNKNYKILNLNTYKEILPPAFKDYKFITKNDRLKKLKYFMMKIKEIVWMNEKHPKIFFTLINSYYDNYSYLTINEENKKHLKDLDIETFDRKLLLKYFLLYFVFSLENKFFFQRRVIQVIRILKVMETSKNFNRIKPPVKTLKLSYASSLYLNMIRTSAKKYPYRVKSQPIVYLLKDFLSYKSNNTDALTYFFSNIFSTEFVRLNYNLFFEFKNELEFFFNLKLNVIKPDYKHIQSFLFNYYLNDFLLFLKRKDIEYYAKNEYYINPKFSYYKYFDQDPK